MAKDIKSIAIDIGSKNVKIVKGHVDKSGAIVISDCIIEPTPEDCMDNGYIKRQSDMQLFLRGLLGKNDLGKSVCNAVLRSSDVVAREISVPVIKGPKLNKLIRNEILTVFGGSSDYYTDYAILEEDIEDYKNIYKIMSYAVPKEVVGSYFDVLKSAEVIPTTLDVHRNAVYKLLKNPNTEINSETINGKGIIMVDMGASYMDVDLIMDGKSIFKRSISIVDDLNLSDDFNSGYESYTELDSYVNPGSGYEGYVSTENLDDYMYGGNNRPQISPIFTRVSEEIYKMMQFAISRQNGKPVTNVYLYGGNSRINGLDQYLSTSLEVSVERVVNISNIECNAEAEISDIMIAAASLLRM